jgi:hypothetical protein
VFRNAERRSAERVPLKLLVRYRILGEGKGVVGGVGRSVDISNTGLFIAAKRHPGLSAGTQLAAVVEWPSSDSTPSTHLFTTGRVVRLDRRGFAIAFKHYKFRSMKQKDARLENQLPRKSSK